MKSLLLAISLISTTYVSAGIIGKSCFNEVSAEAADFVMHNFAHENIDYLKVSEVKDYNTLSLAYYHKDLLKKSYNLDSERDYIQTRYAKVYYVTNQGKRRYKHVAVYSLKDECDVLSSKLYEPED